MADLERTYNVPLRKEWLKVPKYKRSKKAVTALREFLIKHMKSENIKLDKELNSSIWVNGIKNPPHHVAVTAIKDAEGLVKVSLKGSKFKEEVKAEEKKEQKKGLAGMVDKAKGELGKEEKPEEKKEEKPKEEAKKEAPKAEEKKEEPKKEEVKKEDKK